MTTRGLLPVRDKEIKARPRRPNNRGDDACVEEFNEAGVFTSPLVGEVDRRSEAWTVG